MATRMILTARTENKKPEVSFRKNYKKKGLHYEVLVIRYNYFPLLYCCLRCCREDEKSSFSQKQWH